MQMRLDAMHTQVLVGKGAIIGVVLFGGISLRNCQEMLQVETHAATIHAKVLPFTRNSPRLIVA